MKLKRLRGRFGISAPRLAIRPHIPWYWRTLLAVVVIAVAVILAQWIYDAGRGLAGFEWKKNEQALTSAKAELQRLQEENAQLRKSVNVSESSLQIEQTAQQRLTEQVRHLVEENGQLKEELAVFESLASGSVKTSAATVSRLTVEPDGEAGQYRYRLLLTAGTAQGEKELSGQVQLSLTVSEGGKTVILTYPRGGEKEVKVNFRRYLRHVGGFRISPEARLKEVEARLLSGGNVLASTKITL